METKKGIELGAGSKNGARPISTPLLLYMNLENACPKQMP